jgi:hypothetical protein
MAWPQATDYNAAVQNPALCFADADLRGGRVAADVFGLPRPHAGSFADVYQVTDAGGVSWAVKCFTRPAGGLRQRYQAVSDFLGGRALPFLVDFVYLEEGIRVGGRWFPVVKMRWVEGLRLNAFVAEHLDRPAVLEALAGLWLRLGQEMREAGLAHGDLQHGNVLLVPGSRAASLALRLIDYDGLWVPALAGLPSGEVGHPGYQHPARADAGLYDAGMDRFPLLVVYTALRCLRAGGAALWRRHDTGENLLFREGDFCHPGRSRLWPELFGLPDAEARALAGHLLLAARGPAADVPELDELLAGGGVRPLTDGERDRVRSLLQEEPSVPDAHRLVPAEAMNRPPIGGGLGAALRGGLPDFLREVPLEFRTAVATLPPPAAPAPRERPTPASRDAAAAAPGEPARGFLEALGRRPVAAGAAAAAALALLVVVARVLPRPGPPRHRPSPHLLAPDPVTLRGGEACDVDLAVERDGYRGPLTLELGPWPTQVRGPASRDLDEGEGQCRVHLDAGIHVEAGRQDVALVLRDDDRVLARGRLPLTLKEFPWPRLGESGPLQLWPGGSQVLTFPVDRREYTGPLTLLLKDLPRGLVQAQLPAAPGAPSLAVRVRAGVRAALGFGTVDASLQVRDAEVASREVSWAVESDEMERGVRLLANPLRVTAGQAAPLPVTLRWQDYDGRLELRLEGLPDGVSCSAVAVDRTDGQATLQVRAAPEAAGAAFTASLCARAGEDVRARHPVGVQVLPADRPKDRP